MSTPIVRQSYRRSNGHLHLHKESIGISKPTDVLIEIRAVALNFRDTNILHGTNPWAVQADGIPCSDAAAVIVGIGSEVKLFEIGDKVSPIFDQRSITGHEQTREWLGGEVDGVLATHCVFPEEKLVKIPGHLSWAEAACLPCAGLTAWSAITAGGLLRPGMSILIQGTGGVSMMALKIARAAGCSILLTSSSDEKLRAVQALPGFEHIQTINYVKVPDWHEEVIKMNGGVGVDIVLENGGTSSVVRSMKAAKRGGTVSQIGYLSKQDPYEMRELLSVLIDRKISLRPVTRLCRCRRN